MTACSSKQTSFAGRIRRASKNFCSSAPPAFIRARLPDSRGSVADRAVGADQRSLCGRQDRGRQALSGLPAPTWMRFHRCDADSASTASSFVAVLSTQPFPFERTKKPDGRLKRRYPSAKAPVSANAPSWLGGSGCAPANYRVLLRHARKPSSHDHSHLSMVFS
jgi:hypothetical protein